MARLLIKHLPLGVLSFDNDFQIIDRNPMSDIVLPSSDTIINALANTTIPDGANSWRECLQNALVSGKPHAFGNVSASNNGKNAVLHIICSPLTAENTDEQIGGLLVIENVTRKVAMESDLATAERLAAVGKLAARVAHELNNPLDGILRYINLALRVLENDTQTNASHYLKESRKGLLRMVRIISELLEFSRSTYSAFEEADINKIVEDAVKAMENGAEENGIMLVRHYGAVMPNIRSGNLYQVFCNLIKNACDAMPDGGQLDITTYCDPHHAIMEFADTGTGLSKEVKEKMFDAFFTTKATGKGTGLGLAICKDIIERYNGHIAADNRSEGGCVFRVAIPLEHTSWGSS